MPKLIVTHYHPDLDAIMSAWLLVRFDRANYGDATLTFVPAGTTYKDEPVDSDPNVVHVDNGRGRFDHHMKERVDTCASRLVLSTLPSKDDPCLQQMVEFANDIDHFGDSAWPDPLNSRYAFMLHDIIPSLHELKRFDDDEVARMVFVYLDAVYERLREVEHAKGEIASGREFPTPWGTGLAISGANDHVIKIAQKSGYTVVVLRNPENGYMRIKGVPGKGVNFAGLYAKISALEDPERWYFHPSGQMLLNGSDKSNPKGPTSLSLDKVIELIQQKN